MHFAWRLIAVVFHFDFFTNKVVSFFLYTIAVAGGVEVALCHCKLLIAAFCFCFYSLCPAVDCFCFSFQFFTNKVVSFFACKSWLGMWRLLQVITATKLVL